MYFLFYFIFCPVISVFALCVCYFYYTTSCKVSQWRRLNIPFVQPTFPTGHKEFLNAREKCLTAILDQIYRKNADQDLVAFFAAGVPFILLRDPKLIRKVFVKSSTKAFSNSFSAMSTDIEAQSTIFFASDKAPWRFARKVLEPFLTPARIGGPNFSKFKTQVEKLWHYSEAARVKGHPINLSNFAFNFAADCLASWSFSEATNSYEKREELFEIVRDLFPHTYIRQATLLCRVLFPALQNFRSWKFIPQRYIDFMRNFLEQRITFRDENQTFHNDFIDYLMTLRREDEHVDVIQKEIGARQRTGCALAMLLGGSDTISQVCLSVVHLLSLHPEHQNRIRNEIADAMKKHDVSELTFEVIQDLRFTEQCVYETTRLIPFTTLNMRLCSEDFQIPGTNYTIRKGERVITASYSLHRDSKYFADPDKFDPERFSPAKRSDFMAESFISFGCGPRKCPGYKLGVLQAVLFVASILFKYEIRPHSHFKQLTAADFDPRASTNIPREKLLIDLVPRPISTQ